MDINLPLFLFLGVAGTGAIWLFDILFLAKSRKARVAAVESEFDALDDEQKKSDEKYTVAIDKAGEEPTAVEYAKSFFPLLLIVFVLRSFIIEPFQIPSESMVPTLEVGDFILVNKFSYGIRLPLVRTKVIDVGDPQRGDVMVFFPPHEDRYFIKRVIGLPGDTIRYAGNTLYVNGEEMPQKWLYNDERKDRHCVTLLGKGVGQYEVVEESFSEESNHFMRKCVSPRRDYVDDTWTVSPGHYFMMGDNRDNSSDSRVWGEVPEERIVGKAFAIWMHWDSFLPSFSRVGSI
ncbi:Signal peptidase I [Thalassocella blandensis]|nr:Signal peptidase I [Thalassocella blandensis]